MPKKYIKREISTEGEIKRKKKREHSKTDFILRKEQANVKI